jgi:hypothetical protein
MTLNVNFRVRFNSQWHSRDKTWFCISLYTEKWGKEISGSFDLCLLGFGISIEW